MTVVAERIDQSSCARKRTEPVRAGVRKEAADFARQAFRLLGADTPNRYRWWRVGDGIGRKWRGGVTPHNKREAEYKSLHRISHWPGTTGRGVQIPGDVHHPHRPD